MNQTKQMVLEMRNKIDCDHAETAAELVRRAVKRFRKIEVWMYCLTATAVICIIAIIVLFSKL
jgi:cell division protein FtsL